jgi:selenocysteine lyase/cysteine desulfurase
MFGPSGVGVLWGRRDLLEELPIHQLRPAPSTAPEKLETGTKNHECLAGLLETYAYLADLGGGDLAADARAALGAGMQRIRAYELDLGRHLLAGLESVPGLRLYGPTEPDARERVPTFGFTLAGVPSADVSQRLARRGIYCWAGNHYALTLLERLGLEGAGGLVRVGAVHYNTFAEVDRLVEELCEIGRNSRADP